MTKQELLDAGCMVPDTIQEAMFHNQYQVQEGDVDFLAELLSEYIKENGVQSTYFDFYYGTLLEEEQQKADVVLTNEQVQYLHNIELPKDREQVYFRYEDTLIKIAFRLSVTEMLFSTFYFPAIKKTVWTSYEGKFIVLDYNEA